jgi:hypothetical protein
MEIQPDKYKPYYGARSGPFLAVFRTVRGIARQLIGFFMLTESERLKAGIYVSNQESDDGSVKAHSPSNVKETAMSDHAFLEPGS